MITIIIPVFNAESTLEDTLESILSQTYKDYEVIMVDDLSQDNSISIMKKYENEHSNFHTFYNTENKGPGYCRNIGIQKSTGSLIAFIDADDKWTSDKLEKQIKLLKKYPSGCLFYTGSGFMDYTGRQLNSVLSVNEQVNYKELLRQNIISCSSVLVKKSVIEKIGFCEQKNCHEDYVTWLEILKQVEYAYGVNEPLLIYRLSAVSRSGNKVKAALMNWNTYTICGLTFMEKIIYMVHYGVNGIVKYHRISKGL